MGFIRGADVDSRLRGNDRHGYFLAGTAFAAGKTAFKAASLGKKLPFQTALRSTRIFVPKASETWLAISDKRLSLTLPKPSVRASALLITVSMANFKRRSSRAK